MDLLAARELEGHPVLARRVRLRRSKLSQLAARLQQLEAQLLKLDADVQRLHSLIVAADREQFVRHFRGELPGTTKPPC
jgi:hypothetical protein